MGQQQSKDELLYQQVAYGNVEAIRALHADGAGLEYVDKEGMTPLTFACLNLSLYNVAKTLIELGADVNAYRPGRNGGTPLHHAAKCGLKDTVKLLLSHGANALLVNDDYWTPLDIARAKGHSKIVRAIESHICLYSGWLKELYGPGFLEMLAPQLLSRKVWVAVVPCGSRNLRKPLKLELAVYTSLEDAQPCTTIRLTRAGMEEPDFSQPAPAVIISESSLPRRRRRRRCRQRRVIQTRIKLAPLNENDIQQLQQFCGACKGIPQVMHPIHPINAPIRVVPSTSPQAATGAQPVSADTPPASVEDMELSMAINASIQTALTEGIPLDQVQPPNVATASSLIVRSVRFDTPVVDPPLKKAIFSDPFVEDSEADGFSSETSDDTLSSLPIPSAPTITDESLLEGPINYPSIESSMAEPMATSMENNQMAEPMAMSMENNQSDEDGSKRAESSTCAICFDASVEGVCVPCGHMAGCMSCLNEIKVKKWGCPVCRTTIDQVIKVYSV